MTDIVIFRRRFWRGADIGPTPDTIQRLTLDHLETNIRNAEAEVRRCAATLAEATSRLAQEKIRLRDELAARQLLE